MEYLVEKSLYCFSFWAGAKQIAEQMTCEELDKIEEYLTELTTDEPMTETQINDFFEFDYDTKDEEGYTTIERIIGRKIWED